MVRLWQLSLLATTLIIFVCKIWFLGHDDDAENSQELDNDDKNDKDIDDDDEKDEGYGEGDDDDETDEDDVIKHKQ